MAVAVSTSFVVFYVVIADGENSVELSLILQCLPQMVIAATGNRSLSRQADNEVTI